MKKIIVAVCVALTIGAAGCSASRAGDAGGRASVPCGQGVSCRSADGSSSENPASEPTIGSITTVTSASQLRLPLDQYELSVPQLNQVTSAQNLAAHVCLRQLGIDVSEHVFSSPIRNVPRYQLHFLPLSLAQANGYAEPASSATSAGGYSGGSDAATPTAFAAFFGTTTQVNGKPVPKGGCHAWGATAIINPALKPDPLFYIYDAETSTLADTRMLQAFGKWSACMSGKGFTYRTPIQAQDVMPTGGGWPTVPSQAEIATATADAQCRSQVNVQGLWVALMTAYENREISKDLPTLIHDHQVTQGWLSHAASYGA